MKKIRKNSFWFVKYKGGRDSRSYTGCVFVKEWSKFDDCWSTILSKDCDPYYVNKYSGCLFDETDFIRPATKDEFFEERYNYLMKAAKICKDKKKRKIHL